MVKDVELTTSMSSPLEFDINGFELADLDFNEKAELLKQIETILKDANRTEILTRTAENCNSKESILRQIVGMTEKASYMRQKILISCGEICCNPSDYQKILTESNALYQEQNAARERLVTNCNSYGLEFRGITPGNGNCFFEAVSCQLQRLALPVKSPTDLRKSAVNYIKDHPVMKVNGDIIVNLEDFMEETIEQYCEEMNKPGVFADHVIVMATSRMLETDIAIVTSAPSARDCFTWIKGTENFAGDPILLGHVHENHYQSLQLKEIHSPIDLDCNNDEQPSRREKNDDTDTPASAEDDHFIKWIRSQYCKKWSQSKVFINRIGKNDSEEIFMHMYQDKLEREGYGLFTYRKTNRDTIQFLCERHSKPKGSKKKPTETRANNCSAFVSFRFVSKEGKKAVIIRQQTQHTYHDQGSVSEKRVSRLDASLTAFIENLVDQGKKNCDILVQCVKWSHDRGHHNVEDRRYFPTPKDISNVVQAYRSRKRHHSNDATAVDFICNNIMKDSIVYYQPLLESKDQPLIIIYQNQEQRERMRKFAKTVVFMDATYKGVTAYGYAFYCIMVRDDNGRGSPMAYMISSEDSSETVSIFLQKLKNKANEHNLQFHPRSFMVDKDMKEVSAIKRIFPESHVLLCWFHVLQAIYRWLSKKESGISGNNNSDQRKKVVEYMRKMRFCTEKKQFQQLVTDLPSVMPTTYVTKYLTDNWISNGNMWSNFGRRFFHEDQETNNIVERFFLSLKYHFLGGFGNIRIEDLLLMIHQNITTYYNYMEDLAKVGRLKNLRKERSSDGKLQGERLLKNGFGEKIVWKNEYECSVPSEKSPQFYKVNIVKATCECMKSAQGGFCKHINLALFVAAQKGTDLEAIKQCLVTQTISTNNFIVDGDTIEVYLDGDISFVHLNSKNASCTCIAFSHNIECVCVKLAKEITHESDLTCQNILENIEEAVKLSPQTIIKTKLDEIRCWATEDNLNQCQDIKTVLTNVNALHSSIFGGKFRKVTRKRKIEKHHLVFKAPKTDHSYHTQNKLPRRINRKEDGSFKRGRKLNASRKSFDK